MQTFWNTRFTKRDYEATNVVAIKADRLPVGYDPNRATTYTVLNRHGSIQGQGETLASAAQIVLEYDGHTYEIRPATDGKGFDLWVSNASRNSTAFRGLTKSRIFSVQADIALAEADIYRQVIRNASWWESCEVLTDADYAEQLAEANRE